MGRSCAGSPPLTRGKDLFVNLFCYFLRITPAYAGKSLAMAADSWRRRDHPRLRGEKRRGFITRTYTHGSPPLTRGKEVERLLLFLLLGITPAYAGKRRNRAINRRIARDHPRLRGEKKTGTPAADRRRGSPPLTRGKAKANANRRNAHRITPAYAGKSGAVARFNLDNEDHPRLRGEKYWVAMEWARHKGSPPLTRGKARRSESAQRWKRITPAYAGKRT